MQINPKEVIRRKIIKNVTEEQIQQVGIDLTVKSQVFIKPKECANIEVEQEFDMQDTFGIINVRSSFSRGGIFTTSGIYDPGFKGKGGVTIYNMSESTVMIEQGKRIAQMVVFKADAAGQYEGHYNNSDTIKSKIIKGE